MMRHIFRRISQPDDFGGFFGITGHAFPNTGPDIGGVATKILAVIKLKISAGHFPVKTVGRGEVVVVFDQHRFKPQKIGRQNGKQNGPVFAIGIGVKKGFVAKKRPFVTELFAVGLIFKAILNKVQQKVYRFDLAFSIEFFAQKRIKRVFDLAAERSVHIVIPLTGTRQGVVILKFINTSL